MNILHHHKQNITCLSILMLLTTITIHNFLYIYLFYSLNILLKDYSTIIIFKLIKKRKLSNIHCCGK